MAIERLRRRDLVHVSKSLLLLACTLVAPHAVIAYDRNVHKELTRFLAQSAGLTVTAAVDIANEDQRVDDDLSTGPYLNPNSRRLYHFVDSNRLAELRSAVFDSCALVDAGFYFHALEDSYSHAGLGWLLGQGFDRSYDQTYLNAESVEKAMRMAEKKFSEFEALKQRCHQLEGSPARRWQDIASLVLKFVSARKPPMLP